MPMMSFLAKEPEKKQKATSGARFNKQRMQKALDSEQFEVPKGLSRQEIRELILSKAEF